MNWLIRFTTTMRDIGMENSAKNKPDGLFFARLICAENVTN